MSSDNPRPTSSTSVDTSVVWLVSFGDLLTLLFCFFLILTPRLAVTLGNESTKEHVRTSPASNASSGTSLAMQDQDVRGAALSFIPVTVAREHAQNSEEMWRQIKAVFSLLRTQSGTLARVRACEGSVSATVLQELYKEARLTYGELGTVEFEYWASCNRAALEVSENVDVIAVIEFR